MGSVQDIRKTFLSYFKQNGHEIVPSSGLVPHNDPTLMFTNSGMVQFKNVFTGVEKRPYTRASTVQKCLRAGGKHNDLENVGYTARHHTFFEMLGNFSFGDYFKEEAIKLAWDLITKEYGLPAEKLLVTVYSEDAEAFGLWKKIAGLSDNRIIKIPTSDNFWSMGDTGPCGPCSEIFFDHGDKVFGGPPGSADQDGDRFIEIWNLVFMQFEQLSPEERISLPKPSIDTGMGLERLAAILQGKHDNYDIDLFRALIEASADLSGTDPYGEHKTSHRVIADHLRACSFLLVDGVLPSNEGRGYVLRRIMRRAMRHAHIIGCTEPHMHRLVPALIDQMGEQYSELLRAKSVIEDNFYHEEVRFKNTLSRGLKLLEDETGKMGTASVLPGDVAFKLYDTYGFPVDLTQDILRQQQKSVDMSGFETAMEAQKEEARRSWSGSGENETEERWFAVKEKYGNTEFLGYKLTSAEGAVLALFAKGSPIDGADKIGQEIEIITNQTPFYGESGGQVGDIGILTGQNKCRVEIYDTQKKLDGLMVHKGRLLAGKIAIGDFVELVVDKEARAKTAANHSVTHLFHKALKDHLGDQVNQKGSLVNPDKMRFDVSINQPVDAKTLMKIEQDVNKIIMQNSAVTTQILPVQKAIKMGAMALFGEKYGEEVRVITMGVDERTEEPYSIELCGGTHVKHTGDIGFFKITSQAAVSSGVRRFEALTGLKALDYMAGYESRLSEITAVLKTNANDVVQKVTNLLDEKKALEKEVQKLKQGGGAREAELAIKKIGPVSFSGQVVKDVPAKDLKPMVDQMKSVMKSGIAALISVEEGKASIVVGVTSDLVDKFSAVDLVKFGAEQMGGKGGGGRPEMAQAGGPDGLSAQKAMESIEKHIASLV